MAADACDAIERTIDLHTFSEFRQGGGKCELRDAQAQIRRINEATNVHLLFVAITTDQHEQVDAAPACLHSIFLEKFLKVVENVGFEGHAMASMSNNSLLCPAAASIS